MIINRPKRSHSLVHHRNHKKLDQETVSQPTKIQTIERPSLASSKPKFPTRSKSTPQKSIATTIINKSPPPIPQHAQRIVIPPTRSSSLNAVIENVKIETNNKIAVEWKKEDIETKSSDDSWTNSFIDTAPLFAPSMKLWKEDSNMFSTVEDLLQTDIEKSAMKTSNLLWNDAHPFITKTECAAYLGKLDPFCHNVLTKYMNNFNFKGLTIDGAFRKLCARLYFRAETQEIDRILELFAHKYYKDNINDNQILLTADIVYATTYSIMLLNTDLHSVQISSHFKMTSNLFCENTMSTILEQKIEKPFENKQEELEWKTRLEEYLKDIYTSIKNHGVLQSATPKPSRSTSLLKRMGSLKQRATKKSPPSTTSDELISSAA